VPVDLTNLPYPAAMLILIWILVVLQRRQPRIAIGSWLIGLGFVFTSLLAGYFMSNPRWYVAPHTFQLCADLLAGTVFMLYTGRPLSKSFRPSFLLLCNVIPLLAVELLYGLDIYRTTPYVMSASVGIVVCIILSIYLRQGWLIPVAQSVLCIAIGAFAIAGNYRAAAYWCLGAVYAAAGFRLWTRLREATLGRLTVVISLLVWSLSFFIHPWVLFMPKYHPMAELVWTMQKFFLTVGMLLVLLEDKARENEFLAHHDELTGLANRRLMEQRLQSSIDVGHTNVVLIDLNGFKSVNDCFGHHAGDRLLQIIAHRLTTVTAQGDSVARLGGDEFVIITAHNPGAIVNSLRKTIAQPVEISCNDSVLVDASIGVASFPMDSVAESIDEIGSHLLRLADQRMYLDKQSRA
jgi:diguanylate cyclase (GGDEF)-like protein